MKISDIVPREWADTVFVVNCGLAVMFWASLGILVGAFTGVLPRDWLRAVPDPETGAAATLLVLAAALIATAVAVKVWREMVSDR